MEKLTIGHRRGGGKIKKLSEADWKKINEKNRMLMDEFLIMSIGITQSTKKQYRSAIKIFLNWIRMYSGNKDLYKVTKRDFIRYLVYLRENGLTESAISLKKSAVSNLCDYIVKYVAEDDEKYKMFTNFTVGVTPDTIDNSQRERKYITRPEYQNIMNKLLEKKQYMEMAWTSLMYATGARNSEILQLTTDLINIPYEIDEHGRELDYKLTPYIVGKGKGREGVPVRFAVTRECMFHIERWLTSRRAKSDWIFTVKFKKKHKLMSETWANYFCTNIISPIIKRKITPLSFKPEITAIKTDFPEERFIKKLEKKNGKKK